MANLIQNADPKKNPVTSITGGIFLLMSVVMLAVKYLFPVFFVLKQEVMYDGWHILIVVLVGVILIFMDDRYFGKLWIRLDKLVGKKTDTNG